MWACILSFSNTFCTVFGVHPQWPRAMWSIHISLPWSQAIFIAYFSTHIRPQKENAFVTQTLIFCPRDLLTVHELLGILCELTPHVERERTTMVPRSMSLYVTVFHFQLEFGVDTSVYPWEEMKSSHVWNYKCESQALDASLFAKRMTAVPCGLRVTVEGLSQVNNKQLSILQRDCRGRYTFLKL